jgi:hypothetical protein
MAIDPMEAYGQAVAALGEAPAEQLTAFIEERFGLRIEPRYLPIYRATLRERQRHAPAPPIPGPSA